MENSNPPRKILMVVTVGGYTHAAPVLELGKVLAQRGHTVDFATLEGQESWTKGYEFINQLHLMGTGPSHDELQAHYLRMRGWDASKGLSGVMDSKYLFDSYWTQTYHHLKRIVDDPATRPDMLLADFFVDAVKDMLYQYQIPMAMVYPQMPALMCPCSYIPGQPGFQIEGTLTSENASMWLRFRNEMVIYKALPSVLRWVKWTKKMRRDAGVNYKLPTPTKPNYLVLINSFFGLEVPKDIPPLVQAVGPILADTYPPLSEPYESFLEKHKKTLYLALGTHIILSHEHAAKLIQGFIAAIDQGLIDGVIWSISEAARKDIDFKHEYADKSGKAFSFSSLVNGEHTSFLITTFAPQRAILDHKHTAIYLTHGGGSSANEGLYHGKPMLALGFFFDQVSNVPRLVASGTSEALDKFRFTTEDVCSKIKLLSQDKDGSYHRNCVRMQRIARVASRRKELGADLIEEVMYDAEGRFDGGKELRPMHLQTADMRMSKFKANNWDLWLVGLFTVGLVPLASIAVGKWAWTEKKAIGDWAGEAVKKLIG
ncbi:putative UDP-glucoronosyl and UDP-glucosyl transferase [Fusarium austroafricanum]|uniref:Putative UDP-glucoronosyl and UDP-glucosyl transferase n=1 Tax=Fusarium austroafricanum TaxID=2364996 RepID=A0A8H4NW14_9HYPO|nr:putative UDP-glucoronosyl and UDP-glucosyl transferase [Fusarium austroafricanum]